MNETFFVKGKNLELAVQVDTEIFDGNTAYIEAVTRCLEHLYTDKDISDCDLIHLYDENQVDLIGKINLNDYKNSELPPPEWDEEYIMVKKEKERKYSGVSTKQAFEDASLVEIVREFVIAMDEMKKYKRKKTSNSKKKKLKKS